MDGRERRREEREERDEKFPYWARLPVREQGEERSRGCHAARGARSTPCMGTRRRERREEREEKKKGFVPYPEAWVNRLYINTK